MTARYRALLRGLRAFSLARVCLLHTYMRLSTLHVLISLAAAQLLRTCVALAERLAAAACAEHGLHDISPIFDRARQRVAKGSARKAPASPTRYH